MAKCNADDLVAGDHLSTTVYYTVVSTGNNGNDVEVVNEDGEKLYIHKAIVASESFTAVQQREEVVVTRTRLVEELQAAGDTIFRVRFVKKNNESRTLIGRRLPGANDTCFGRTQVLESVRGAKPQKREIDHRTLEELTIRNKRYKLK